MSTEDKPCPFGLSMASIEALITADDGPAPILYVSKTKEEAEEWRKTHLTPFLMPIGDLIGAKTETIKVHKPPCMGPTIPTANEGDKDVN